MGLLEWVHGGCLHDAPVVVQVECSLSVKNAYAGLKAT